MVWDAFSVTLRIQASFTRVLGGNIVDGLSPASSYVAVVNFNNWRRIFKTFIQISSSIDTGVWRAQNKAGEGGLKEKRAGGAQQTNQVGSFKT